MRTRHPEDRSPLRQPRALEGAIALDVVAAPRESDLRSGAERRQAAAPVRHPLRVRQEMRSPFGKAVETGPTPAGDAAEGDLIVEPAPRFRMRGIGEGNRPGARE